MATLAGGKARRIRRILDPTDGRSLILPLDHVLVSGCVPGAENLLPLVRFGAGGQPDAVMVRYGEARRLANEIPVDVGLVVRLSGADEEGFDPTYEPLMTSVAAAAALGADGVCATLKLGSGREADMLVGIGHVAEECDRLGLVFLCEAFALDHNGELQTIGERPARAARIAQELGADVIKIANPCDLARMREITAWCQTPIVVAGGALASPADVIHAVESALAGGAAGVAVGRNVISHPQPALMQRVLREVIHSNLAATAAITQLEAAQPL